LSPCPHPEDHATATGELRAARATAGPATRGFDSYFGADVPNWPLRGYKSDVWPGVVKPGSVCRELVQHADLLATCANIVGARLPHNAGEDSVNLLPLLAGGDAPVRETAVNQSANGLAAIRKGPWKVIFGPGSGGWSKGRDDQPAQLYNLDEDLGETKILLWCNAGTENVKLGSSNCLHHSASYAQANLMWVVCCNAVGGDCYGTSLVVGPSGDPLVVLPTDQEALGLATINLASSANWDRYRLRLES
jgi:hypothetical protein